MTTRTHTTRPSNGAITKKQARARLAALARADKHLKKALDEMRAAHAPHGAASQIDYARATLSNVRTTLKEIIK